ncbi:UNVERIFIED_CONTAM: hypothetical protein GTU68_031000 [Idotea baltica]|nr:hypothetical protein [Idotea baltica]
MTPIYQTSTYVQAAPGDNKGYEYSRAGNPTRSALETALAVLENGKHGLCFSSGMAAADAAIKLLRPGDEVVSTNDLYGGSYRMFTQVFAHYGIKFTFVNMGDLSEIEAAISEKTKMVWMETPTNPTVNIVDIAAVVAICKPKGLITVSDNTFATPYCQNPLDMGVDIVLHSITKYLGGHSDVLMGGLVTKSDELRERLFFIQKSCGAVPGPMDCFLVLRGIKTLHLRMRQHCENAMKIAAFLDAHPKVEKVNFPGLGGMLSFTLKGDVMEEAIQLMSNTQLFALAESLGGVESLIGHPASMTHASIPKAEREAAGLKDTLIRVSVGIEDAEDLIEDLRQAIG